MCQSKTDTFECKRCGESKDASEFYIKNGKPWGKCKSCVAIERKNKRETNPTTYGKAKCLECGSTFDKKYKSQKYCSIQCSCAADIRKKQEGDFKECTSCGHTKSRDEFPKRGDGRTTYNQCKDCKREYDKHWQRKIPDSLVRGRIKKVANTLDGSEIPQQLIETWRETIKIRKLYKEIKHEQAIKQKDEGGFVKAVRGDGGEEE